MATTYAKTSDTELQVTVETAVVDQVTYTITQLNELKQRNLNEIARIEQEILTQEQRITTLQDENTKIDGYLVQAQSLGIVES
jgi:hypothetical protein